MFRGGQWKRFKETGLLPHLSWGITQPSMKKNKNWFRPINPYKGIFIRRHQAEKRKWGAKFAKSDI